MPHPSGTTLIDRVDATNEVVGRISRADALRVGANFRTVHALVFTSDGRLVVQRIGAGGTRHPGLLGSSMAGYLYAGESYEDAARRRTEDELGIRPRLLPLGVTSMIDERSLKFVGVFQAVSEDARIADPEHVAALEVWNLSDLVSAIDTRPEAFTSSFRRVLAFFLEADGRQDV
jgi:isopentenyl-diphosphate delta-isomerase